MHSMASNPPDSDASKGSVILIASTSGYFGGTGVVSYISSKHGVVGLGRSSQRKANELGLRVNVVAPFFTPTYITTGYSEKWKERGLPANTVEGVAKVIIETSVDPARKGHSLLVSIHTGYVPLQMLTIFLGSGQSCEGDRNCKNSAHERVAWRGDR